MASSEYSIIISAKNQADKALKNLEKSMFNMQKAASASRKALFAMSAVIGGVGAFALKSAADLEATQAKYNTVFQGMTEQSDAFIKEFQKLTPATKAEAQSMASSVQDLLVPMGHSREAATQMTAEFMNAGGALANFNSGTHTSQEVMAAMNSAITGQYKPLKALGIQLDKTTIANKAIEQGLISQRSELTPMIASQILLQEVYAQSTDALEAYTVENLDTITSVKLMKAQIVDLAANLGTKFLDGIRGSAVGLAKWLKENEAKFMEFSDRIFEAFGKLGDAFSGIDGGAMGDLFINIIDVAVSLTETILSMAAVVAETLTPAINWIVEKLNEWLPALTQSQTGMEVLAVIVGSIAVPALIALAAAVWGVIAPLLPFIAAGVALYAAWKLIVYLFENFGPTMEAIGILFGAAKDKVFEWADSVSDRIGEWANDMKEKFGNFKDNSIQKFSEWKESTINTFNSVKTAVLTKLDEWRDALLEKFNEMFGTNITDQSDWKVQVMAIVTSLDALFLEAINHLIQGVKNFFSDMVGFVIGKITEWKDSIVNSINGVIEKFTGVKDAVQKFKDIITNLVNRSWDLIINIPGLGAIKSAYNMLTSIRKGFSGGGIVGGAQGLAQGGIVNYLASGGSPFVPRGTDTVPAMLTPGELVLNASQQKNLAGQIGGQNIVVNLSGANFYGDDKRFAEKIGNMIAQQLKNNIRYANR